MKITPVHIAITVSVVLVLALASAIVMSNTGNVNKGFNRIVINGNTLLKDSDYYIYAALRPDAPGDITASGIRQKLLSHRYVQDVVVNTDHYGAAMVTIKEKACVGRVLSSDGEYLLTAAGELIKILPHTLNPDVVVINGLEIKKKIDAETKKKLFTAYQIIKGTGIDSAGFGKQLSELMVQSNGMIFASFVSFGPVFIIDEKNLERQIAYMFTLVRAKDNYKEILQTAQYIDVRYDKKIFVGGA